jgi:hypothetical protein
MTTSAIIYSNAAGSTSYVAIPIHDNGDDCDLGKTKNKKSAMKRSLLFRGGNVRGFLVILLLVGTTMSLFHEVFCKRHMLKTVHHIHPESLNDNKQILEVDDKMAPDHHHHHHLHPPPHHGHHDMGPHHHAFNPAPMGLENSGSFNDIDMMKHPLPPISKPSEENESMDSLDNSEDFSSDDSDDEDVWHWFKNGWDWFMGDEDSSDDSSDDAKKTTAMVGVVIPGSEDSSDDSSDDVSHWITTGWNWMFSDSSDDSSEDLIKSSSTD